MFGFGWHLSGELINVALTGANASKVGDLGTVILSHVRHGNRVFVDIHSDVQCARLVHG
jgi:hypothetical protein